jgi:branched-subunit amino acid ABC-type transport system permease component
MFGLPIATYKTLLPEVPPPNQVSNISNSTIVITKKEIEESTAQNVVGLLQNQVDVVVRDFYGNGKSASVDVRGFGETGISNVLVLVDGRRVIPDQNVVARQPAQFFWFAVIILIVVLFLYRWLDRSVLGATFRAIKVNEGKMKFLGYDTFMIRWMGYTLSCGFAQFASWLKTRERSIARE